MKRIKKWQIIGLVVLGIAGYWLTQNTWVFEKRINPEDYEATLIKSVWIEKEDREWLFGENDYKVWTPNNSEHITYTGHTPNKHILNGIIIDIKEFEEIIIKENETWTLVHEVGHWLGLKHIWGSPDIHTGNTIDIDFDDCLVDDGMDDTPKQKDPHPKNPITIQYSCDGKSKTNHQNFMDYSYSVGMFTEDQVNFMRNYLIKNHSGLLWVNSEFSTMTSVLSKVKQRSKFGTRIIVDSRFPFGTISDRDMVYLFSSINIPPTSENLEKIGLKIVANDKFKDFATGEFVNQHQIYERLDIDKAKSLFNTPKTLTFIVDSKDKTLKIGFINPNYYDRTIILMNSITKKEFKIDAKKAGINYGDKKTTWAEIPKGTYNCEIYTSFTKKKIRSFQLTINKDNQLVNLIKNGLN